MNRHIQRLHKFIFCTLAIIVLFPFPAAAESARSLVESGNELFSRGDFGASLEKYEKAAEAEPESAIILFNKGDALYRQERFTDAFNVFEQAAEKALADDNRQLEALSRYNMGNSAFRQAETFSSENPQKALEEYKRSSGYYSSAVKLDPGLTEAAHNLEVSRIAAKKIEEIIRQQEQQAQQQAQQKQEVEKNLQKLQQEQQEAADQSRELADSQQQQGREEQAAQQAQNQQSITERTKEAGEEIEQLNKGRNSKHADNMARELVSRAVEKQQEAEKNLQQNDFQEASENQQEAAEELQKALQQLAQEKQEEKGEESQPRDQEAQQVESEKPEQQPGDQDNSETGEQPTQAAGTYSGESPEDIINEEIENRKYRSARGGTGYVPVDKDW